MPKSIGHREIATIDPEIAPTTDYDFELLKENPNRPVKQPSVPTRRLTAPRKQAGLPTAVGRRTDFDTLVRLNGGLSSKLWKAYGKSSNTFTRIPFGQEFVERRRRRIDEETQTTIARQIQIRNSYNVLRKMDKKGAGRFRITVVYVVQPRAHEDERFDDALHDRGRRLCQLDQWKWRDSSANCS